MIFKDDRVNEVLGKAIKKAVSNGYMKDNLTPEGGPEALIDYLNSLYIEEMAADPESLIFDHDFCRSIWAEESLCNCGLVHLESNHYMPTDWKTHIQKMVLEDDPISYLAKFV